jgi:hypothetical protein
MWAIICGLVILNFNSLVNSCPTLIGQSASFASLIASVQIQQIACKITSFSHKQFLTLFFLAICACEHNMVVLTRKGKTRQTMLR